MAQQAPPRTVRDLTGMLNSAGHVLANRLAGALAEVGLTDRMQCVLVHALEQERTQIQLAVLADLDKTTMVSLVDEMERRGFAERRPAPADRRARIVVVTDLGRQVAQQGQEIVDRVHGAALEALPEAARSALIEALTRIVDDGTDPGPKPVRRVRQHHAS
ncbi:MarR family winged helix-turn-helix transcriptional regulator [Actinoplanes sp. NPDC051494]|uniref:MarR family winged helix-turn-helix transcriptional regulator n=1 Tax=Actinoplanes sp. NPDC051494 TaxID=3363907 RepID=UPI00378DCDF2